MTFFSAPLSINDRKSPPRTPETRKNACRTGSCTRRNSLPVYNTFTHSGGAWQIHVKESRSVI